MIILASSFQKKFPILGGCCFFYFKELFIKIGGCIEARFVTYFANGHLGIHQLLTGMADPNFIQKIDIGFLSAFFKIAAKSRYA